jgi:hypothetical protein
MLVGATHRGEKGTDFYWPKPIRELVTLSKEYSYLKKGKWNGNQWASGKANKHHTRR